MPHYIYHDNEKKTANPHTNTHSSISMTSEKKNEISDIAQRNENTHTLKIDKEYP